MGCEDRRSTFRHVVRRMHRNEHATTPHARCIILRLVLRQAHFGEEAHDFSPRLKPGVSWVRTKQETPNALPTPLAPPFLPIAKARGISEDLDEAPSWSPAQWGTLLHP